MARQQLQSCNRRDWTAVNYSDQQKVFASERMADATELIDLITLVGAGIDFYNMLVERKEQIKVSKVLQHNVQEPVHDIESLLLRMQWLVLHQMSQNVNASDFSVYLNWKQFRIWLSSVQLKPMNITMTQSSSCCTVQ